MNYIEATRVLSVALLAGALLAGPVIAQEPPVPPTQGGEAVATGHGAEEAEHHHANELALFLGGTHEDATGETGFTVGLEYERDLSHRLGMSFVAEHVSEIDAWVFLAPVTLRPVEGLGLKLYGGPGVESKDSPEASGHGDDRESSFVLRGGVGWVLELGERMSLTPQLEMDYAREDGEWERAIVFGVAVGAGF